MSEKQSFANDPTGGALAAFTAEVGGKLTTAEQERKTLSENVAEFSGRIEAVEQRAAKLPTTEDLEAKFEKLASGDQFDEIADRLKAMEAKGDRLEKFAAGSRPKATEFQQALMDSKELEAWRQAGCPKGQPISFKVPTIDPRQGRFAESSVVLDDTLLGDASEDVVRSGMIELLRDPIGLIDIMNMVPAVNADTYKALVETMASSMSAVAAYTTSAVDGDPTPVAAIPVDNLEPFFVGQVVYVNLAAGRVAETITGIDTVNSELDFGVDEIDYDIPAGTLIFSREYLATAEGQPKPATALEVAMQSVEMQKLAAYVILTRQRMERTNTFDLTGWINRRLPLTQREVLEWHLLYGSGTAPQLDGFLNHADLETDTWSTTMAVGDTRADLILYSAANIPGDVQCFCVMHKLDWFHIKNAKASSDGHYVHGEGEGPRIIDTPGVKAIGNVRVVLSKKIAQTTGLVLAPMYASELAPGGDAQMLTGYVGEQLIENKITMLYEQSWGHLITDPRCFRKVDMDSAPT